MQELFKNQINNLVDIKEKRDAFNNISFKHDWKVFHVLDKKAYFIDSSFSGFNQKNNDVFVNKIKIILKKAPSIFKIIYKVMNPSWSGVTASKVISGFSKGSIILNLGSGVTVVRDDVINIDFYPFENVDFIADIASLPFADSSVDAIISETVLEHVPNPKEVVSEMFRVLKPGGKIYIVVPFIFAFHSSPNDYYRWSKMGLREEFRNFEEMGSGIHFGPGHAVGWTLSEYFSTIFSFGLNKVQQVLFMMFLIIFTPLSYLDFILNRIKSSENIASCFYFIGRKK